MEILIKNINKQLKNVNKKINILNKILIKNNSKEIDLIIDKLYPNPPKNCKLKMTTVSVLCKKRLINKFDLNDFIYVIEPQNYNKVSKLTPKHNMFNNCKNNPFGYFHSSLSGIAHSGDGGDHGDTWWIANKQLLIYLTKLSEKIDKIIINFI
jgi:hypothetical protein